MFSKLGLCNNYPQKGKFVSAPEEGGGGGGDGWGEEKGKGRERERKKETEEHLGIQVARHLLEEARDFWKAPGSS